MIIQRFWKPQYYSYFCNNFVFPSDTFNYILYLKVIEYKKCGKNKIIQKLQVK